MRRKEQEYADFAASLLRVVLSEQPYATRAADVGDEVRSLQAGLGIEDAEVPGEPASGRRICPDAPVACARDHLLPKEVSIVVTSASKGRPVAAGVLCAVFVPFVLIHLLRAVGITWGLEEMFGWPSKASLGLTAA